MDSSSIARDLRAEKWRRIVLEANNSGMPKIQYIHEHNLSENRFYYWQRVFRKEAIAGKAGLPAASSPSSLPAAARPQDSAFIEVTAPSAPVSYDDESDRGPDIGPVPSWDMLLQKDGCSLYLSSRVSEKCLNTVLRAISHA